MFVWERPIRFDEVDPAGIVFFARYANFAHEAIEGFFEDLESLLERVVPGKLRSRERLLAFLLGPRSEQVPFADGTLCLGQWQRILLFSLDAQHRSDWTLTLLG